MEICVVVSLVLANLALYANKVVSIIVDLIPAWGDLPSWAKQLIIAALCTAMGGGAAAVGHWAGCDIPTWLEVLEIVLVAILSFFQTKDDHNERKARV